MSTVWTRVLLERLVASWDNTAIAKGLCWKDGGRGTITRCQAPVCSATSKVLLESVQLGSAPSKCKPEGGAKSTTKHSTRSRTANLADSFAMDLRPFLYSSKPLRFPFHWIVKCYATINTLYPVFILSLTVERWSSSSSYHPSTFLWSAGLPPNTHWPLLEPPLHSSVSCSPDAKCRVS
jgi:hypothetical protein